MRSARHGQEDERNGRVDDEEDVAHVEEVEGGRRGVCEGKSFEGDRRRMGASRVWETREVFELKAGGRRGLGVDRQARREGVRVS